MSNDTTELQIPRFARDDNDEEEAVLRDLNNRYVNAFLNADAAWYDAHLTDDFICVHSRASVTEHRADMV